MMSMFFLDFNVTLYTIFHYHHRFKANLETVANEHQSNRAVLTITDTAHQLGHLFKIRFILNNN